jgi:hypothetical protein
MQYIYIPFINKETLYRQIGGIYIESKGPEEFVHSFQVSHNFISAQFAFSINAIDEYNRYFCNSELVLGSSHDDFHLEGITFGLDLRHDVSDDIFLVESKRSSEISSVTT